MAIELVPDLVWYIPENSQPEVENAFFDFLPDSPDPLLSHKMPTFPAKFLLKPPLVIQIEEVSAVWTAVIVAIMHLLFEFFR